MTARSVRRCRQRQAAKVLLAGALVFIALGKPAFAQVGFGAVGGVYIDAEGMLRESSTAVDGDRPSSAKTKSSKPNPSIASDGQLRHVSLARLERAVAAARKSGAPLSDELRHLAGLRQVRYVYFYPEAEDVVLVGPAEVWQTLPSGEVVGHDSGRPLLDLDDLIVALRYAFAETPTDGFLGCSIEPTEEGMRKHAEFLNQLQKMDRAAIGQVTRGMEAAMGPQKILVYGVPPSSRFALELIAADYRLKRLALAHDRSPSKKVPSFLDLSAKQIKGGPQPQHRWWFVGTYDAILHSADFLAWEFEGNGLRVETAPTRGTFVEDGQAPKPSRAATQFAEIASREIDDLARAIPAFGALQNLVSLAVAAELIRRRAEDDAGSEGPETNWRPEHFLDAVACPIAEWPVPRHVPSLANVRLVSDRHWLFSTSGGVEITPAKMIGEDRTKVASGNRLSQSRQAAKPPADPQRWWWD